MARLGRLIAPRSITLRPRRRLPNVPGLGPEKPGTPSAATLSSVFRRLRAEFLAGVMVLLPLGVIGYLAWSAFQIAERSVLPVTRAVIGVSGDVLIPILAFVLLFGFVVLVGVLTKGAFGRRQAQRMNRLVERIPIAGSLIAAVRQVADTVLNKKDRNLKQTCLIEFPKAGTWCLGLVSADPRGEIADRLPSADEMLAVYVGLPPFTAAFLVFVPKKDVIMLDMKADDEVKLLATAGIAYPAEDAEDAPPDPGRVTSPSSPHPR